ncbi:VanZ family protein [Actinomadura barringtoniae]|uniref:VanZ family protein n=1 Tax=Actinomadura barringtoniae TaxID=1427535 RepID=A0A939PBQ5_9ACTN|nr:VanZ family protein [Actinomadura barringtoniae]MBO2446684.1 VanZ family protein [Actinomadura barringtoniae]
MEGYAISIALAFVVFPFVALVALFPYVAAQYRRRGRLGFGQALLASGFAVYVVGLVLLVNLPIPNFSGGFCATRASHANLHWFQTFDDMRHWARRDGGKLMLGNPALEVRVLNVALFVPLGMFLRHLFGRGVMMTVLIGFLVSLAIELTQLTAVWGLFPCSWRSFDVDDLWSNTLGALVGALAAPVLRLVPGQVDKAPEVARPVTAWRRLLGMACDGVLVVIIGQGLLIAVSLAEYYLGDGSFADKTVHRLEPLLGWWVPGGLLLVLVPLLNGGRSPGQWAVMLRPVPSSWWRRLVQVAAGPVLLLAVVDTVLVVVLLVVNGVAAFFGDHRGVSGSIAGVRFADARDPEAAGRDAS